MNPSDLSAAFDAVMSSVGYKVIEKCEPVLRLNHIVDNMDKSVKIPGCVKYGVVRLRTENDGTNGVKTFIDDPTHSAYVITTYVEPRRIKNLQVVNGRFVNKNKLLSSQDFYNFVNTHLNNFSKSKNSSYNSTVYVNSKPNLHKAPKWVTENHILFKFIIRIPNGQQQPTDDQPIQQQEVCGQEAVVNEQDKENTVKEN